MQAVQSHLLPYTNSSQRAFYHTGRRQSLSGSETDVSASTSTENLTAEEKHVLRSGVRQEPQGEETLTDEMDASSSNTLIIHHNTPLDPYSSHFYSKGSNLSNLFKLPAENMSYGQPKSTESNKATNRRGSMPPSPKCTQMRSHFSTHNGYALHNDSPIANGSYPSSGHDSPSVQEITEIPKHYLDQSEVLKHLAKEMHQLPYSSSSSAASSNIPPPPEYPKRQTLDYSKIGQSGLVNGHGLPISVREGRGSPHTSKSSVSPRGSMEKSYVPAKAIQRGGSRLSISRSHPDLSNTGTDKADDILASSKLLAQLDQSRPETWGRVSTEVDSESPSSQALQMIELLSAENTALKSELDLYHKKIFKLQKFELEIEKVQLAHEELVRSTEKRERLEKAIKTRLENEVRRLHDLNRELREQLDAATTQLCKRPVADVDDCELRKELGKRDIMITQVLSQNKELLAEKERHEIELQAQRATLQEQRNHIEILDNALTNAQANVVRLEEESRKKQAYVDRVTVLQRAIANLQLASDRRLQMEKRLRTQLEKEIETLRGEKEGRLFGKKFDVSSAEEMKKMLREYEEKIIALEAEVTKWEQRYLEESTMRQIAVDAASVPKDAKIAALERTSQESEKLIAQARCEKLKHMDELYAAQRKSAELEGKIKDLESKLAERDAMIKVLQQHSQEKDAVLQNAVRGRPPRGHTRAASTMGLTSSTGSSSTCGGGSGGGSNSCSTPVGGSGGGGSASAQASLSTSSSSATLHRRTGSKDEIDSNSTIPKVVTTKQLDKTKSLDEQFKELDSRLSSKDSIIGALRAEKERYPNHFWRV